MIAGVFTTYISHWITLTVPEVVGIENLVTSNLQFLLDLSSIVIVTID